VLLIISYFITASTTTTISQLESISIYPISMDLRLSIQEIKK